MTTTDSTLPALPALPAIPLYEYQIRGLDRLRERQGRAGLFMEMGTGKTRVALAYLAERGSRRILVVVPVSAAGVWVREIRKLGLPYRVVDLVSLSGTRAQAVELGQARDGVVVLINYEAYWRDPLADRILAWGPDAVVLDEAHRIRHRNTRQSRFAHRLADRADVRLALTGTPITNGLQDVWSIYRFIDRNVFGGRWKDFASRYLQMGGYGNYQIVGYRDVEAAHRAIAQTSYQCRKIDAIDLPDRVDIQIPVSLSQNARDVYRRVAKDSIAKIMDADGQTRTVIATITLTQILRLQQITSGFVTDWDTNEEITLSTDKLDVCRDLVRDARDEGQQVVVFCRFRYDVASVASALREDGYRIAQLDGSVDGRHRERMLAEFAAGRTDVLVAQIRVGAVGIDLTAASVAIFYSTGYSLDDLLQARDRLHRIGQTRKVTYYHLTASQTVDEAVYAALRSKTSIARRVTDLGYALDLFRAGAAQSPGNNSPGR